jgi:hypothetical protein
MNIPFGYNFWITNQLFINKVYFKENKKRATHAGSPFYIRSKNEC